jgi:hypothetical protein
MAMPALERMMDRPGDSADLIDIGNSHESMRELAKLVLRLNGSRLKMASMKPFGISGTSFSKEFGSDI